MSINISVKSTSTTIQTFFRVSFCVDRGMNSGEVIGKLVFARNISSLNVKFLQN